MHRKAFPVVAAAACLLAFPSASHAQSVSFSIGSSSVVDYLVSGAVRKEKPSSPEEVKPAEDAKEKEEPGTFRPTFVYPSRKEGDFKYLILSTKYEYTFMDSSAGDGNETDNHYVAPEVFFTTDDEFSLSLSAGYASTHSENRAKDTVDADSVIVILTPAQELLRFGLTEEQRKAQTSFLHLALGIAYRNTQSESEIGQLRGDIETDAVTLAPTLLFTQVLGASTTMTAGAIYAHEFTNNDVKGLGDIDDQSGVVSLELRADQYFPMIPDLSNMPAVQAWVLAAWKHDTELRDFPPGITQREDWAEFGAYMAVPFGNGRAFRAGYSIETLHDATTNHQMDIRFEAYL